MSTIRKAARADLDAVCRIYDQIHTAEERGEATIGWQRGVYPERETAEAALARGDLFVQEQNGEIVGTAILNQTQVDSYAGANWRYDAPDSEVMVLHTLVIDPEAKSRGLGREFAAFYEGYALAHGCRYLRIDTNARNARARRFYQKLGYAEIGVVPCTFNGIAGVQLVLLEKRLPPLRQITADEAPRLRACVQALFEHHNRVSVNFKGSYPSRPYDKTLSLFAQALEENVSRIAVIEEDSGIVGFCKVDLHGDGTGKLDYLVVLPQCPRQEIRQGPDGLGDGGIFGQRRPEDRSQGGRRQRRRPPLREIRLSHERAYLGARRVERELRFACRQNACTAQKRRRLGAKEAIYAQRHCNY